MPGHSFTPDTPPAGGRTGQSFVPEGRRKFHQKLDLNRNSRRCSGDSVRSFPVRRATFIPAENGR